MKAGKTIATGTAAGTMPATVASGTPAVRNFGPDVRDSLRESDFDCRREDGQSRIFIAL